MKCVKRQSSKMSGNHLVNRVSTLLNAGFILGKDAIKLLTSPNEYYEQLLYRIRSSKTEISFSTLYIGDGPQESQILQELQSAMSKGVNLQMILDGNRQSRSPQSLHYIQKNLQNSRIGMYKNHIARILGSLASNRAWEGFGVNHIKYYVFDDYVVLSGYLGFYN